jgi:hypothetical protein
MIRRRDAARQDDRLRHPRLARPPVRPARRHSVDGGGRLPGGAKLLDRPRAQQRPRRAHGPEARGRRGLPLPDRRAPPGRQDRAARPDRRLLRLGAFRGRAAHARRRRIGHRAADGDDPDARSRRQRHRNTLALLLTQPGRRHLSRRARAAERERPHGRAHADRLTTARMDELRATSRRRNVGRGRAPDQPSSRGSTPAGRRRSSRRWPRRSCGSATRRERSRPNASDPPEAEMDELMLDGNAVAGPLQELFG